MPTLLLLHLFPPHKGTLLLHPSAAKDDREHEAFRVHHFYNPSLIFPSLQHTPHPLLPILSSLQEKVCQEADFFDRLTPAGTAGAFLLFQAQLGGEVGQSLRNLDLLGTYRLAAAAAHAGGGLFPGPGPDRGRSGQAPRSAHSVFQAAPCGLHAPLAAGP